MDTLMKALVAILLATGTVFLIILILGLPTMWLWNWLMPEIFGLKEINFLQAVGLMMLAWFILPSGSKSNSNSNS